MFFNTAAEWHAALNDLPPTLFVASVGFDLLGSATRRDSLKSAGLWTLIGGVLGAVAAVVSGLIAEDSIQHSEVVHAIMERHETWAISVSIAFALLAVWRIWRRGTLDPRERPAYLVAASLAAIGIIYTAHLGGVMVFRHGAGVPSTVMEQELRGRAEGHHHEAGEEHGEGHEHAGPDSGVDADTAHSHMPATTTHKDE
jgi:uncharacterized membrane protein